MCKLDTLRHHAGNVIKVKKEMFIPHAAPFIKGARWIVSTIADEYVFMRTFMSNFSVKLSMKEFNEVFCGCPSLEGSLKTEEININVE